MHSLGTGLNGNRRRLLRQTHTSWVCALLQISKFQIILLKLVLRKPFRNITPVTRILFSMQNINLFFGQSERLSPALSLI